MLIPLTWSDVAIRLCGTVIAAALVGLNRTEHGRAAGLRTSILVSLAACIAMIQVNVLLPLAGRHTDSFVMNDLMRLPLGVLSGMGFIGAGAIVRRGKFVTGITTAATLWFLTIIGLCFGGGQIGLGITGTALGWLVLVGLKVIEDRMTQDRQANLQVVTNGSGPDENEIRQILRNGGLWMSSCGLRQDGVPGSQELTWELRWRAKPDNSSVPDAIRLLADRQGVVRISWTPQGRS